MNPSNVSNMTFQNEASRKRKILDFVDHNDSHNVVSYGYLAASSAKECCLGKEPCSQNSAAPNKMHSDSCWKNSQVFALQDLNLVKAPSTQFRSFPVFPFSNSVSSIGEKMKDPDLNEFANGRFNSMMPPEGKPVISSRTFPSDTPELSGTACLTRPPEPTQANLHTTILTGNHMMGCQNHTQAFSMLMAECTDHAIPSIPDQSLVTFEVMKTKIEFSSCCVKDTEIKEQTQRTLAQKPVLLDPSSCEKVDQSYVTADHPSLRSSGKIQQKVGRTSYKAVEHSVQDTTKTADISNMLSSHSSDEDIKSVFRELSPSVCESLWDGALQLSTSVRVSAVAFFKSGEKIQDIAWPRVIEIKGRVKLEAFEKFVQELPRSRNRSLMVISLCWKVGSSKSGFKEMKEVTKGFEVSQKVGFAHICPGFDLYVCPRSEAVITILAKYGFFKGISAVETNQDSLVGCVVWRRNHMLMTVNHKKSETGNISPHTSAVGAKSPTSLPSSERHQTTLCFKSPDMASNTNTSKVQSTPEKIQEIGSTCEKIQDVAAGTTSYGFAQSTDQRVHPTKAAAPISLFKPASTFVPQSPQISPSQLASHEVPAIPEIQQHVQPSTGSQCRSLGVVNFVSHYEVMQNSTSSFQPMETGLHMTSLQSPDVPRRIMQSGIAAEKNLLVEGCSGTITQQKIAPSAAKFTEVQQSRPSLQQSDLYGAHSPHDDDLPEFDFSTVCGADVGFDVHPLNKETSGIFQELKHPEVSATKFIGQMQQPSFLFSEVEVIKPHEEIARQKHFKNTVPKEITNLVYPSCNKERENFRNIEDIDDEDDMPEWCFPELDQHKHHKISSTKLPSPTLKSFSEVKVPLQMFPPITTRSIRPPKIEGLFNDHYPHIPPRSINAPNNQNFPQHHPPAPTSRSFSSSKDHGEHHGTSPNQQHGILGRCPVTSNFFAASEHSRPHTRFAPSIAWRPMLQARDGYYGSKRSDGFSSSYNRLDRYSSFGNRSDSMPTHSGHR